MNLKRSERAPLWVICLDIALIVLVMALAYWSRYRLQWFRDVLYEADFTDYLPLTALFALLIPGFLFLDGSYHSWRGRSWVDHVYRISNAGAKTLVMVLAIAFFFRPLLYSRLLLLEAGIGMWIFLALARAAVMYLLAHQRRSGKGLKRLLIVGAGEVGRRVMRTLVARPDLGYRVIGYVDDNPEKGESEIGRFKGLGAIDNLVNVINTEDIDEVIVTLPWTYHRRILTVLRECDRRNVQARIVPDIFQLSLSRVDVGDLGGLPLISINEITFGATALLFKRIVDTCGALLGLTLGAPLLGLIALAIRLDSPGPILFRQQRVGKDKQLFMMYKFRSMREGAEAELEELREYNEADGPLFKMRDDPRLTRVGTLLRRTSLDELPQLLNVLRGEMSLVGPRPPVQEEVEQYQPWHLQRLAVPPGMTGLWQVSGRSELTFDEMVLLDLYYIEHWSPWLDLMIMLRTIPKVLLGDGAY